MREKMISLSRLSKDFCLGVLSSVLVTLVTQILVYPIIAKNVSQKIFGIILTVMAVVNIITVVLGGSLNNIRLIKEEDYKKDQIKGDFSLLLILEVTLAFFICIVIAFLYSNGLSILDKLLLFFIIIIQLLHSYGAVEYRIKLNFVLTFFYNLSRCLGYLLGLGLFFIFNNWIMVFLIGELVALIFLTSTTSVLRERIGITPRFFSTLKDLVYYTFGSLTGNIFNYLDRFIILPILGAHQVAIYYSVTTLGKMGLAILGPMMGVLLSYLVKLQSINKKRFKFIILLSMLIGVLSYIITVYLTPYFLSYFYPHIANQVDQILYIALAAISVGIMITVLQPFLFRFSEMKWQTVIQIIYGIIYITFGISLSKYYGLFGFCVALLLSNVVKAFIMIFILRFSIQNKNRLEIE